MPTDELRTLDLTFASAEENLACDEALLDWCEETGQEVLRFFEPAGYFVVLGYGNRVALEVNAEACEAEGVRIYRRSSGGGTVLQGPGCLNYALVLRIPEEGPLATIAGTNQHVMEKHRAAVEVELARHGCATGSQPGRSLGGGVQVLGHSDLAISGRKFSGNAQRRKRRALLFHGTFLLRFELPLVGKLLKMPLRQPDYRQSRSHEEFLVNLPLSTALLKEQLRRTWGAGRLLTEWPADDVQRLASCKYEKDSWNMRC